LRQVNAARELGRYIHGEDLRWYVIEFFRRHYPGCEFVQTGDDFDYEVTLSSEARADLDGFLSARKLRAQTRLGQVNASRVPCRFENAVVSSAGSRREIINQFHPIIRFVSDSIKDRGDAALRPAIAVQLPRHRLKEPLSGDVFVFAVQRWSMTGLQDAEYLHHAAMPLSVGAEPLAADQAELLITIAATHGVDWLTAQSDVDCEAAYELANERCVASADAAYDKRVAELKDRNEDRAAVQAATVTIHHNKELASLQATASKQRAKKAEEILKMTEGRIKASTERYERRIRDIDKRRSMTHHKEEICVGVLKIID
jgi:hypothetical protein